MCLSCEFPKNHFLKEKVKHHPICSHCLAVFFYVTVDSFLLIVHLKSLWYLHVFGSKYCEMKRTACSSPNAPSPPTHKWQAHFNPVSERSSAINWQENLAPDQNLPFEYFHMERELLLPTEAHVTSAEDRLLTKWADGSSPDVPGAIESWQQRSRGGWYYSWGTDHCDWNITATIIAFWHMVPPLRPKRMALFNNIIWIWNSTLSQKIINNISCVICHPTFEDFYCIRPATHFTIKRHWQKRIRTEKLYITAAQNGCGKAA